MSWLHLYAAVQVLIAQLSHSGPRVPAGTRSSLRSLSFEGEATKQSSGETSREDAKLCLRFEMQIERAALSPTLRHCERSEAIQSVAAEKTLDCFAALAMTSLLMQRAHYLRNVVPAKAGTHSHQRTWLRRLGVIFSRSNNGPAERNRHSL
ncbi:hypothetical protein ACVWXO_006975 [Bradyrhizobium sp. LM2.7]